MLVNFWNNIGTNIWYVAAIWMGLAFIASLISIRRSNG